MSDFILFTITLAVTGLGLLGSWAAYSRRGLASGMRGAAWSTVPLAAYLTGLTKFLSDLVFSPVKWAGIVLFGLGALLYVTSGAMLRKGAGPTQTDPKQTEKPDRRDVGRGRAPRAAVEKAKPALDPDLAEIEQILKKRGIS
jgi:hypothetical protein